MPSCALCHGRLHPTDAVVVLPRVGLAAHAACLEDPAPRCRACERAIDRHAGRVRMPDGDYHLDCVIAPHRADAPS